MNTAGQKLYLVEPTSGNATLINLGAAAVPAGDGILLDGKTLYVVQNQLNQVAVIALDAKLTSGKITAYLTDSALRIPTTVAEFGNALYLVNARFGTPSTPDTAYEIVRLSK